MNFLTEEFAGKKMKLRRSDQVHKSIGSVAEISDTGTFPIFNIYGGAIIKDPSGTIARRIIAEARDPTLFERTRNVYKLPMWIPIPTEKVRKAAATAKTEVGSSRQRHTATKEPRQGGGTKEAAVAPAQSGWERRDHKGRIRPADEPQPMELDVVMKESEYMELMAKARIPRRRVFPGWGAKPCKPGRR